MPGTILLDDLRDSIGQQLGDYASGLTQAATAAVQPIAAAIPTPQTPDPNAILQELQQHAAAAAQAAQEQAQPALQVLGGAQQAAGGAVTQLGQTRDQITQQLQQHAQDVVSGAQDVGQQLQDHVNTVLGSTTPQAPAGVQALPKPQPPTLGAPAQPAQATGADVLGGPPAADTTPPDRSMSYQDYARAAAVRAGIDPNIFVAQIQQESGFNPQAKSGAGALGIAQFMPATAQGMNVDPTDPYAALDAAAKMDAQNLAKYGGDYSKTLAAYNAGGGAVDQYGGVPPYKETQTYVSTILNNAKQASGGVAPTTGTVAPPQQTTAQARASDLGYTDISQFGDQQLSNDEAYAACGPAAAVRFAERFGRNPTLREATDLAKQVGWTASGGMAGIQSEQQLLKNMGVDTHVVAPDWDAIAKEAQTGNPVTISTPGHYYFADGYNPESGAFHVGQSGLDLRQGSEWMTPAQMESLMGKAQGALFADNPNVPAKGAAGAPTALGGTTGAQNAPITLGGPAPARAPLYADTNQPATPIQSAQDVLGQAGEAVGGAASALGTAAQQALAQAQEINRIQPGTEALKAAAPVLGGAAQSASTAVNLVAQDVQNAAQGVLGAAQDVNRLTPGATAVNAAAPVLGAAASDLGTAARGAADTAGQTLGGLADQAHQQIVDAAQTPAGQALIQAGVQNATDPSLLPAGSRQLYQQISDAKNQWIDQNNPVRDVPVVGGLVSGIAQQLSDPLALATFGPTVGAGEAAGTAVAERLAPEASQFVQQVASKLTSGAIVGGIQNGLAAAEAPGATPQSVGEAVLTGAGLGAAMDVGGAALRPVVVNVGRMVLDRAGALADAGLRAVERISPAQDVLATTRRAGESDADYQARLNASETGPQATVAAPATPPAGRQRLPNYPADTPEGRFEAIARPLRESSRDGLLHLDLNTLPKDVLPLDRNVAKSSANGLVKLEPGGLPTTDDLRALYQANTAKRDFYYDQADQGIPTVGAHNLDEWFATNAITSMQTNVSGQVGEAARLMGTVRQVAQEGRDAGLAPQEIKANILKAVNDFSYSGPAGPNKRIAANRGYATGVADTGGPKTPTFAGNYGSAEQRVFDPGITNDIWNWRTMNIDSSQVPAMRGGKQYLDAPHESAAANNKNLYRGVEAVFNELGAEQGVDGFAFQSSVWDGIRAMAQGDPAAYAKWKAGDFQGAIADAKAAGIFDRPIGQRTGAPEPGEISRAMNQPGVRAALQQYGPYLKDPLPPELGISGVQRAFLGDTRRASGTLRPATAEFRQGERAVAESYAPLVRGVPGGALDRLGVDERGVMPWLATAHRVVEETPGEYVVHLPSGNSDTARYVASEVGSRLGLPSMDIHWPDYRSPDLAGVRFVGDAAEVKRLQGILAADGHATVVGPTGRSLQVPLYDEPAARAVADTLQRNAINSSTFEPYNGGNERIPSASYAQTLGGTRLRFEPTTAERRGLLERAGRPAAEGTAEGRGPPGAAAAEAGTVTPTGGGIRGPGLGTTAGAEPLDLSVRTISQAEARQLVGPAYDPSGRVTRPAGQLGTPEEPEAVTARAADAAGVSTRAAADPIAAHTEYAPNSATPLNGAVGHQATAVTAGPAPPAGTPLERINAMYAEKPGGPSIVQRVADGRTAVVRALTDRGVDIADAQQQYAKALGRPLNADELMYEMSRLQPGPAAEARVQQDLGPIVKSVGNDYNALRNYVTARSNVQVADAVGTDLLRTQADANVPTALRDKVNATQTSLRMRQEALNNLQNASVPDDARVAAAQRSVNSAQRTLDRAQAAVETARQAVIDRAAQSGAEASANRMFSGGVSKADSQTAINQIQAELGPERFAKVQQAADQLSRYGQSLRDTLVSSGVLNEEQANGMLAKYPDWVKTRILKYMDEQTGGGAGQGQRIGLSSRDVHAYTVAGTSAAREDPIASMVAYTYQVERMAQKNNTFNALVKLDQGSPNPQLRQVSSDFSPTAAQSTVQGFVNGTKQRFVTDNKALGQAIEGASQTALPGFLTAWTNVFRALAASRNPAFVAGHASFTIPQYLIRQTAIEGGPQSLPRVIGALAQGYGDVFQGFLRGKPLGEAGPGTQQLLRGGGGQFGALTGSQEDAAKAVRQMGGIDISKPQQAMNLVKNLITLKPVENLVNRVDYGPRVAAMRLAEARGAHPVQAIVAGRDATIDFNRGGTATKLLSQMIPFLNVGVQGPLQVARTFVDNPRAAIYTVGTLLGAPTLAAEIWNNADPQRAKDYADVPQYIKDQGIVIMLPTEAPVDAQGDRHPQFAWINTRNWTPFVSATREATDAVMGTSTHNWEQAAASMMSSALPVQAANPSDFAQKLALSAPGVQTIAQLSLNKDFYRGSDIVTKRADVGASPTAQFLTPGLQQVANAVAPGAEVRPSAVDFAIRNIGAGTAGAALSGTDAALRAAGYPPAQVSRPTAAGPAEIPVAGSVIGRFVRGQTGQELQTARGQVLTPDALQLLRSNGITTTPAADTSSVNQIPLKLDEEARYQQLTNQYVDAAIHRTAASPSFANMTQVGKQSLMSAAIGAARQKAGIEVLNTIPAAEKARRLKTKSTAPAVAA